MSEEEKLEEKQEKIPLPTELADDVSMYDKYQPCARCETIEEAVDYMVLLIKHNMCVSGNSEQKAREIEEINVGYYAGYCGEEGHKRILELFDVEHPVFGKELPTGAQALRLGEELGEAIRQGKTFSEWVRERKK